MSCPHCNTYSIGDAERDRHVDEIARLRAELDIVTATADLAAANYKAEIRRLRTLLASRRAPRPRSRKAS